MEDKLKLLLEQIKLPSELFEYFNGGKLIKIVGNKEKTNYKFFLLVNETLPVLVYSTFKEALKQGFSNYNIDVSFETVNHNKELIREYFTFLIDILAIEYPLLVPFRDYELTINDTISIKVANKAESMKLQSIEKEFVKLLSTLGYGKFEFIIDIDEAQSLAIREEINNSKRIDKVLEKPKEPVEIKGAFINKATHTIQTVVNEEDNVSIEGYIFGLDIFESSRSEFKIFTLKITDFNDSMYAKVFTKDNEEFQYLKKRIKANSWYTLRGYAKYDKYSNEIVLNIRDINSLEKEVVKRKDNSPLKRVELHTHTKMSQMDGISDDIGLIKQAISFGHKAIAITDHNCAHAYPHAFNFVSRHNKGKEDDEKFKVIYGTEVSLIDDVVNIVLRGNDSNLLDTTYVVFDFETTGFNAGGGDTIIEAGAVKIKNGEIIDRFDELINPLRVLPKKITEITGITDLMLKDKDTEENVIKRFNDWCGDLVMVAHNAKFDVSFLEMAYQKYNLGTFSNTVIDTLELSRTLDNNFARHSLSALVKRYDVKFDEGSHHRADYDSEGTALVFHKMLLKLTDRNFITINDLNKLVSKDEIHKYGREFHINILVKNKVGLKNLFKILSLANTKYLHKTPRILRSELEKHREGLLFGSGCYNSEVFVQARSKSEEELLNVINFYDYVEVQPLDCYNHLLQMNDFGSMGELIENINKIIRVTKDSGKLITATGDVHHIDDSDRVFREIIVNQKVPGGGRHPLARNNITKIPSNYFRTTDEMLEAFSFLDENLKEELVITNPNLIADMVEFVEVIIDTKGVPFSPYMENSSQITTDLVYEKASSWYGNPLPYNIEERIAKELYGDSIINIVKESEELSEDEFYLKLNKTLTSGYDTVFELVKAHILKTEEEAKDLTKEELEKKVKKNLGGIIGGGFDVIYLISQKLVKKSNDDGYIVGSRGSVGSSFVATMMGITEVNPLPSHYRCLNCQHSIFEVDGEKLSDKYLSGFDLPDHICPKCNEYMFKDGNDMPFATFLGFNADKVPDIDLNFSDLNQAAAHEYTKVLFGEDNVFRAGTIGTVAEKTAYGFAKGYFEDKGIMARSAEVERLASGCVGVKRTTGQHPGGIVVVPDYMDVYDFTPFQFPADDNSKAWRTTHFDYHAIEECLLKLDILGHSDPTQLRMIQDLSGQDVTKVPLDDKKTMGIFLSPEPLGVSREEILCETGTLGIPEFGTGFTVALVAETKPTTFAELIKISGLSHGTDVWVGNAQELIKNNIVPFKEVIGCRDDIMVYLMFKGMKPIKAFKIMEFVRKGRPSREPEAWAEFAQEMKEAGIEEWYIDSCFKIKYMFPKAHATAYVMSAFRIAYYKVHYPQYFYASWFSTKATDFDIEAMIKGHDAIKEKIKEILEKGYDASNKESSILDTLRLGLELTARGLKIANIDLYRSQANTFLVDEDNVTLIPPFSTIDGLGGTVATKIVEEREKGVFLSIEDLQKRAKVSGTLVEKMKGMGILTGMSDSNQLTLF